MLSTLRYIAGAGCNHVTIYVRNVLNSLNTPKQVKEVLRRLSMSCCDESFLVRVLKTGPVLDKLWVNMILRRLIRTSLVVEEGEVIIYVSEELTEHISNITLLYINVC